MSSTSLPKHLHVIGICGVATSALAIAFKDRGVKVTGSDKGFFPPVSTELEKHKIDFYAGWHPEKIGTPDVIMVGAASSSQNPETAYAKEHGIPMYSYPEMIGKYFAKEKSVVCVGTWGKTSSSTLLSYILSYAGFDPSYMFGGISLSHDSSAKLTDSLWSVFEGDEYRSSPTDPTAKFFHYKPSHLLLTAVSWDHADLYPTEESYFATFKKLLSELPREGDNAGFVVACANHEGSVKTANYFNGKKVFYGREGSDAAYTYRKISQSTKGLDFVINHDCNEYVVHSPMLGAYQAENITGCFAMAHELGVAPEKILEALANFRGMKRRMEKRLDGDIAGSKGITVIDDIAHSGDKVRSVLTTLRAIYGSESDEKAAGKVIVVFEPNSGGRSQESAHKYDNAFKDADIVVIPRLTKLKVADSSDANAADAPMEGDELAATIGKTHDNVHYIESDEKVVTFLLEQSKTDDVVAFLGSHGFRGMIEETVKKLG